MRGRRVFRAAKPYLVAVAVIVLLTLLVAAILLTQLDTQWLLFLTGVLTASILALASRATQAEWSSLRNKAKLSALQDKYKQDVRLRERMEATLAKTVPQLKFVDELLPTMLACVDVENRVQYHNQAFRNLVGLKGEQIDGSSLKTILGGKMFGDIEPVLKSVLAGSVVTQQKTRSMRSGALYKLHEVYVPYSARSGGRAGFFILYSDITERSDLPKAAAGGGPVAAAAQSKEQDLYVDSYSQEVAGSMDAARQMVAAIERNDFRLLCQRIQPLATDRPGATHYEVLIRLVDEDENTSTPGAFFPLVEKYGLMPKLDRWVVEQAVNWASFRAQTARAAERSMLFINLASATLGDADFADFVERVLKEHRLDAGALCFEVSATDAAARRDQLADLASRLRKAGCRVALSGFGRDEVSFALLKDIKVDFLKIDGSIILRIHRDPLQMAKLTALSRVAKTIGIKTVAELVEDQATVAALRNLGIDYAQGFGISVPGPLSEVA